MARFLKIDDVVWLNLDLMEGINVKDKEIKIGNTTYSDFTDAVWGEILAFVFNRKLV